MMDLSPMGQIGLVEFIRAFIESTGRKEIHEEYLEEKINNFSKFVAEDTKSLDAFVWLIDTTMLDVLKAHSVDLKKYPNEVHQHVRALATLMNPSILDFLGKLTAEAKDTALNAYGAKETARVC